MYIRRVHWVLIVKIPPIESVTTTVVLAGCVETLM